MEDYKNLEKTIGYRYVGSEIPRNSHTPGTWNCPEGHPVSARYSDLKYHGGVCAICAGVVPKTAEDYQKLEERTGYKYLGLEIPTNTKTKGSWLCPTAHPVRITFNELDQRNSACRICFGRDKTLEDYEKVGASRGLMLREKRAPALAKTKVWWDCIATDGAHSLLASFNYLDQKPSKTACAQCAKTWAPRKTIDDYRALEAKTGYKLRGEMPERTHDKADWWCPEGHPTSASYHTLNGNKVACPSCHSKTSTPEKLIFDLVQSEFLPDVISQARVLPGRQMKFDIYSPSQKIAIEVDGTYWHQRPEAEARDTAKNEAAAQQGVKLIRISVGPRHRYSGTKARERFLSEVRSILTSHHLHATFPKP